MAANSSCITSLTRANRLRPSSAVSFARDLTWLSSATRTSRFARRLAARFISIPVTPASRVSSWRAASPSCTATRTGSGRSFWNCSARLVLSPREAGHPQRSDRERSDLVSGEGSNKGGFLAKKFVQKTKAPVGDQINVEMLTGQFARATEREKHSNHHE